MKPEQIEARRARLPQPEYDGTLPVHEALEEVAAIIRDHAVSIICGETGSGKTTQIPKVCLTLGRGAAGMIGCTQPRRMAARSVATRLAQELKTHTGEAVGYKVRFHDRVSPDNTFVKVMTDGILLSEIHHDPLLKAYDTLIVDEAHERSLNIDFLLGYLKRILPRRPDLKVIITSATLEAERLSKHFDDAPILTVSGRTWPVEVRYRPPKAAEKNPEGSREEEVEHALLLHAVDELARESSQGDILVFLPGEREIRQATEALRKHHPARTEILPLMARLSFAEQDRVFKPSGMRRIVLSTNVAETSLTVPGIRYVVDAGLARVNRYSLRNRITQLQVEKVSQASARQRAGRCGRVASGICIRLYDEKDFAGRPEYTTPEILRSSLAAVILKMAAMGLGRVEQFPFLDMPSPRAVDEGYRLLDELGALTPERKLSKLGQELAKIPADPRIGRILLAAREQHCLSEMLVIAAFLSVQDPRERPLERRQAADEKHARFRHEKSEFLEILNLWKFFEEALQHKKSGRKFAQFCFDEFLSLPRMMEWRDIHTQYHSLASDLGIHLNQTPATYEQLHKALLTGFLGQIGLRNPEDNNYLGARGVRFSVHPASTLSKAKLKWIMAADLMETQKVFGRLVAEVNPDWIEAIAGERVQRSWHDPWWDAKTAQASAFEAGSLYGLPLVSGRKVRLGPHDPKEARRLFIRHALVLGEFDCRHDFFRHNQELVEKIENLEHKARRQDVLVDEEVMAAFFEPLIPADVWSGQRFEAWWGKERQAQPKLLHMSTDTLMRHSAAQVTEAQFPETIAWAGMSFPLLYRFDFGHPMDGVTVSVPVEMVASIPEARLEWLVPGMIRDKVTHLLKKLPHQQRKELVPLPDAVTAFLEQYNPGKGSLRECLNQFVEKRTRTAAPPSIWSELPEHMRMMVRVVDEKGDELESLRDVSALQQKLKAKSLASLNALQDKPLTREQITRWDFGDLPATALLKRKGLEMVAWPALVDHGLNVAIELLDSEADAHRSTRQGAIRLARLELAANLKSVWSTLRQLQPLALRYGQLDAGKGSAASEGLKESVEARAFQELAPTELGNIRLQNEYLRWRDGLKGKLSAQIKDILTLLQILLEAAFTLQSRLNGEKSPTRKATVDAIRAHLNRLLHPGFIAERNLSLLRHYPRYLTALSSRLDKCQQNPTAAAALETQWRQALGMAESLTKQYSNHEAWPEYLSMLEEFHVSLFAQHLKTPYPISLKRLEKFRQEHFGKA